MIALGIIWEMIRIPTIIPTFKILIAEATKPTHVAGRQRLAPQQTFPDLSPENGFGKENTGLTKGRLSALGRQLETRKVS